MFKKMFAVREEAGAGDGTGGAGAGSGTPPGTGAPGGAAPNEGGTGAAGGGAWYDTFQDPGVKDWLKAYGPAYPNAEAVALKALNLEKFVGADKAGRGVIVPKPEAKPEEWQAFYKKVGGVPDAPAGYTVHSDPKIAAELTNDPLVKQFQEHAHKTGMPPLFFQSAMEFYTGAMKSAQEGSFQQFNQRADVEMQELHNEWQGIEYDKNLELGRRAAKMFLPHENSEQLVESLTKMEGALGTKATMKLWASIGKGLAEHGFVGGGDPPAGGMSPEGARVKIDELKRDTNWQKRFASGDREARAEFDQLHKVAYPDPQ